MRLVTTYFAVAAEDEQLAADELISLVMGFAIVLTAVQSRLNKALDDRRASAIASVHYPRVVHSDTRQDDRVRRASSIASRALPHFRGFRRTRGSV